MTSNDVSFHTAVFDALCSCLNLSADEGIRMIHEAYAEPENAPRPSRKRNVVYWTVIQDTASDPVSTEYEFRGGTSGGIARAPRTQASHAPRTEWTVPQFRPNTEREEPSLRSASGSHVPVVCTTMKYQLIVVCYGPACEEYAMRIRHMLYLDGAGFPRRILREAGIFPVPDPPMPSLLHEEEGSLWRKRADLTIALRVRYEERGDARNSIALPATVTFYK